MIRHGRAPDAAKDVAILHLTIAIAVIAPRDRKDAANQKTVDRIVKKVKSGKPVHYDKLLTKGELKRGLSVIVESRT